MGPADLHTSAVTEILPHPRLSFFQIFLVCIKSFSSCPPPTVVTQVQKQGRRHGGVTAVVSFSDAHLDDWALFRTLPSSMIPLLPHRIIDCLPCIFHSRRCRRRHGSLLLGRKIGFGAKTTYLIREKWIFCPKAR